MTKLDLLRRGIILRLLAKYLKFESHITSGTLYLKGKLDMALIHELPESQISIVGEFLRSTLVEADSALISSMIQASGDMQVNAGQIQLDKITMPLVVEVDIDGEVLNVLSLPLEDIRYVSMADVSGKLSVCEMNSMSVSDSMRVYLFGSADTVDIIETKPTTSIWEVPISCTMLTMGLINIETSDCFNVLIKSYADTMPIIKTEETTIPMIVNTLASMLDMDIDVFPSTEMRADVTLSVMNAFIVHSVVTKLNTELVYATIDASADTSPSLRIIDEWYQKIFATIFADSYNVGINRIEEWYQNVIISDDMLAHQANVAQIQEWYQTILAEVQLPAHSADAAVVQEWYQTILIPTLMLAQSADTHPMEWYLSMFTTVSMLAQIANVYALQNVYWRPDIAMILSNASLAYVLALALKKEQLNISTSCKANISPLIPMDETQFNAVVTILASACQMGIARIRDIDIQSGIVLLWANAIIQSIIALQGDIELGGDFSVDTILRLIPPTTMKADLNCGHLNLEGILSLIDMPSVVANYEFELNNIADVTNALACDIHSNTQFSCDLLKPAHVRLCRRAVLADYAEDTLAGLSNLSLETLYYIEI